MLAVAQPQMIELRVQFMKGLRNFLKMFSANNHKTFLKINKMNRILHISIEESIKIQLNRGPYT